MNDKGRGILVVPYWLTQSWFPMFTTILEQQPASDSSTIQESSGDALKSEANSPSLQHAASGYLSSIRAKLKVDGFSVETIEIILSS